MTGRVERHQGPLEGRIRQPEVGFGTPGNAPSRIQARSSDKAQSDAVRLVPLGGLEEIGRNCSFLEYKNEIVIIDIGLQFPEEETPGIDYIIPNISYLEKKKENIRGDHPDARPLRPHRRPAARPRKARQSPDLRDLHHESHH